MTYAAKGTPLKQTQETEKLEGGAAAAGGTAGTGANVPTYSAGAAGGGANSNYDRKKTETDYGVNKKVKETKVAKGAVNKLNVALMVDKTVPAPTSSTRSADRERGRRHRPGARRHVPGRPDRLRQGGDAQGGPGADDAARPAQVGRPRPRLACCSCSSWSAG